MSHLLSNIISNLESIVEHGGYAILSLITILEGVPIIGSLIPGHTVVILSGFFAKTEIFHLYIVIPLVIISAMIGDFSGYYLGKKYGYSFLNKFGKLIFIKDLQIEKAKEIVNIHTGKAIIFGRFNPLTRPLIPFIVGASKVHINKFWLFDFIGVGLWAVSSIGLGYIFGASYHIVAPIFGKFIFIAIIISILILWAYGFINRKFHIFAKYELITLILNLTSLYIFFKTVQDALSIKATLAELDVYINIFINNIATIKIAYFMNILTDIFSPTILSVLSLILIFFFIIKKEWKKFFIIILTIPGGLFFGAFIKELVQRIRPISNFILETGYSFPSGHSLMITLFISLIIYFYLIRIKSLLIRELSILFSVILILLISFTRLYLGVHWFTDIVAGISFGVFWITSIILLIKYIEIIFIYFRNKELN